MAPPPAPPEGEEADALGHLETVPGDTPQPVPDALESYGEQPRTDQWR